MEKIPAPFDGKNLCDDSLRDDVFRDCYEASDMKGCNSHIIGMVDIDCDEECFNGIVDVQWQSKSNVLRIELLACPCQTDFFSMRDDFFHYYERKFKKWENEVKEHCFDDEDFCVEFKRKGNVLYVVFWWICE